MKAGIRGSAFDPTANADAAGRGRRGMRPVCRGSPQQSPTPGAPGRMPLPRAIDRAPNNINLAPESSENPKMRIAEERTRSSAMRLAAISRVLEPFGHFTALRRHDTHSFGGRWQSYRTGLRVPA